MKVDVQTITPSKAAEMLERNNENRKIRPRIVSRYASDMKAGKWKLSGDPIRFNGDGSLLDGQHRLAACVQSKTAFESVVISGLGEGVMPVLDSGVRRTFSDVLKWRGEMDVTQLGAAVTLCWRYDKAKPGQTRLKIENLPSHHDLLAWLDQNPEIRRSMRISNTVKRALPMVPRTAIVAGHFITSRVDSDDADEFMDRLAIGSDLPGVSPILALRNWIEKNMIGRDRPTTVIAFAVTIKMMNAWRLGDEVTNAFWRGGGKRAEEFPRVVEIDRDGIVREAAS